MGASGLQTGVLLLAGGLLTACAMLGPDPFAEPAPLVPVLPRPAPKPEVSAPAPSAAASDLLRARYGAFEADLLADGALRTEAAPLSALAPEQLATNFIRIALFDEYTPVDGSFVAQESESRLRRWDMPVEIALRFGASVTEAQRTNDTDHVAALVDSLAEATAHPITLVEDPAARFSVFVVNEAERRALRPALLELVPNLSEPVLRTMLELPVSTLCLVVAFSSEDAPHIYRRAIAIVRNEHPPRLRQACLHEEIAQGLGLPNDSPDVRPSIFNDDEEFALLTAQDRAMLRMLYDPRLTPGMGLSDAAETITILADELLRPLAHDATATPKPSAPPAPVLAAQEF